MADAIVSVLTQQILDKLNFLQGFSYFPCQKICLPRGFEAEVLKLQDSLSAIQAILEGAEQQQEKDEDVRSWLKKFKDVAYDADDVLDEIATEFLRQKMDTRTRLVNKVRNFFSSSNQIAFRLKMSYKIKEINDKIDEISAAREDFQFRILDTSRENEIREYEKTNSIFVDDSTVASMGSEYEYIVKWLIRSSPNEKETISVLCIVGMGGLGKTTLAQLAYNNGAVQKYFDLRTWVCVSDDCDVKRLIREILGSIKGSVSNLSNLDALLQSELRHNLRGKRFLLVLDDVWDVEMWGLLKSCIRHGTDGTGVRESKILVTTRNPRVASIMGSHRFSLRLLTEKESWSIFKQQVFRPGGVEESSKLRARGKEIMNLCNGLPLAVRLLGGLLCRSKEELEWLSVRDRLINRDSSLLEIVLQLSYENLPSHLKQCFAYCSIFPKDYKIKKDMLIQLWIAEGFIPPFPGSDGMSLEDTANEYFNHLLARSFFRNQQIDAYGDTIACEMHDLIHDFARFVSKNECSIVQADKLKTVHGKTRRLSFVNNVRQETYLSALDKTNKSSLHTFFMCQTSYYSTLTHEILLSFKYLRVLDLSIFKLVKLSPSIGKLIHLRYLDLSFTDIQKLPKSITHLLNLQTLRLINCWDFVELPKCIAKMINLRHLEINMKDISMPKDIGQLTNLQILPIFPVLKDSQCGIGELGHLQNLRGSLEIFFLENLKSREDAGKANLKDKKNLLSLKLWWSRKNDDDVDGRKNDGDVDADADDVMEGLQPPPQLKGLEIFYFPGVKIPSWMMIMRVDGGDASPQQQQQQHPSLMPSPLLSSLEVLRIKSCANLLSLSNMAGFPLLKHMYIEDCGKLTSLPEQLEMLTSLKSLWIRNCPNLKSLPAGIQSLTSLEKLRIEGCLTLCWRCERERGKDWQLISHIPTIMLDIQSAFDPFSFVLGMRGTHAGGSQGGSQLRDAAGGIRDQDLSPKKVMLQPPMLGSIGYLFVLWLVWLSSTKRKLILEGS